MEDDGLENKRRLCQNGIVQPLLTDLYQITMAYAYWKAGKVNDTTVFDLFFRQNPFKGEFTIFAGLEECLRFLENFNYTDSDIEYLRNTLQPSVEPEFYTYLRQLTASEVTVYAVDEGSVVFPRVPLLRVEGPLIIVQLLETTLLTLVNFASLMATNAARYRIAAGRNIILLEFGLRRAQGPDGGLSASKYSYVGGFDGTSNVLAGKMFQIPVKGTHAHSYITSFGDVSDLRTKILRHRTTGEEYDMLALCLEWRDELAKLLKTLTDEASNGEIAALISYAIAFPEGFMALVDTYDVQRYCLGESDVNCIDGQRNYLSPNKTRSNRAWPLQRSGLLNFCAVAMALNKLGYRAIGIRIDSGDLAYLSCRARETFQLIAETYDLPWFAKMTIVASNDINEETILSLNDQGHKIDSFGIGTHLVTCQRQPALGCVYKMVEINGRPRIKLSQEVSKVTMPGRKDAYRLYGGQGHALIDILQRSVEEPPKVGNRILCRHPFEESKRAYVVPARVESLYKVYWTGGKIACHLPTLEEVRQRVQTSLQALRPDHKRNLNPTPYKVAVSDDLYNFIHDLWLQNAPIGELS